MRRIGCRQWAPAPKSVDYDEETGERIEDDHVIDLGDWAHPGKSATCRSFRLVAIGGGIALQETIKGKVHRTALEHKPRKVWRKGRAYLYIELPVPCRTCREDVTVRLSLQNSSYADDPALHDKLMSWVRAWPPTSLAGEALKGFRQSVEAMHSRWDGRWSFKRIPAWSTAAKHHLLLGWAIGNNLLALSRALSPP